MAQWLRCCATNRKVAGSIPVFVFGIFHCRNPSDRTMALGVDSASNRNEYQEDFLGAKCGRCVRLTTLPPPCAVVMKSGNLNFLEPSGPLQACIGAALPLHLLQIPVDGWVNPENLSSYDIYVFQVPEVFTFSHKNVCVSLTLPWGLTCHSAVGLGIVIYRTRRRRRHGATN